MREITDTDFIYNIAKRAVKLFPEIDFLTINIDLKVCNDEIPLKLEDLLNANDVNFIHDIIGIYNNMNRKTGKIENCFLPRYAK